MRDARKAPGKGPGKMGRAMREEACAAMGGMMMPDTSNTTAPMSC